MGRATSADIVLQDPASSRRHALLHASTDGGLEVVPIPGAPTKLNGALIGSPTRATSGDTLEFPGRILVTLRQDASVRAPELVWSVLIDGQRIGLRSDAVIGGADADVIVPGWPMHVLHWSASPIHGAQILVLAAGVSVDGQPLEVSTTHHVASDQQLTLAGRTITFQQVPETAEATRRDDILQRITLEMLPTGGQLTLELSGTRSSVLLAERRYALAATLLAPPAPYRPGELIPDDVVLAAVWPRSETADRGDLNQLAFRLRADLRGAGLTRTLVERFAKGGATRFITEGAEVVVKRT